MARRYLIKCTCSRPKLSIDSIKCSECDLFYHGDLKRYLDMDSLAFVEKLCSTDASYCGMRNYDTLMAKFLKKYPDLHIDLSQIKRLASLSVLMEDCDQREFLSKLREDGDPNVLYRISYTQPGRIQTPDVTVSFKSLVIVIKPNETGYKLENRSGDEILWELSVDVFLDKIEHFFHVR
jgi:hypothetical protein